MFTTSLEAFKTNQQELHRRAVHFRLVKSLEKPYRWANRINAAIGHMLIAAGQNLVKRTMAAH